MPLTIAHGLSEPQRRDAAALYWEAFGAKLNRILGPQDRALAYVERAIQTDHAIAAMLDGRLVGIAGFKSPKGGFADGRWQDLRAVFGILGATWRLAVLSAFQREIDNDRFLIDGICVAGDLRGQEIGTMLVTALCDLARERGYPAIRLEVIDTNFRAQALYQRLGFQQTSRENLGLLRFAFGFSSAITMIRPL